MNNALCGSEDTFDKEHNLVDTPLEGCRDVSCMRDLYRLACDNVLPSSLEHSHVSTFRSQPSFSPEYTYNVPIDNFEICDSNIDMRYADNMFHILGGNVENFGSLGYHSGYDAALDPYYINLADKLKKIVWNTFFVFSFDFSMTFFFMKRAVTFFPLIL